MTCGALGQTSGQSEKAPKKDLKVLRARLFGLVWALFGAVLDRVRQISGDSPLDFGAICRTPSCASPIGVAPRYTQNPIQMWPTSATIWLNPAQFWSNPSQVCICHILVVIGTILVDIGTTLVEIGPTLWSKSTQTWSTSGLIWSTSAQIWLAELCRHRSEVGRSRPNLSTS